MVVQDTTQNLYWFGRYITTSSSSSCAFALSLQQGLQTCERGNRAPKSLCCLRVDVWVVEWMIHPSVGRFFKSTLLSFYSPKEREGMIRGKKGEDEGVGCYPTPFSSFVWLEGPIVLVFNNQRHCLVSDWNMSSDIHILLSTHFVIPYMCKISVVQLIS